MSHERIVLGSLMLDGSLVDETAAILTGREFADPRHERIYGAIRSLADKNSPTDAVAVADSLGSDLKRMGGHTYLHECVTAVSVASSCAYYAERVREAHYLRTVKAAGVTLANLGDLSDASPLEVVNAAREQLDALVVDDAETSLEQDVFAAIESLDEPLGPPTPWRDLNRAIGGWSKGMLHVIGARPGVGKTVLGVGIALDMARRDEHALFVSLEMPKRELLLRMCSSVGSIDGGKILHRKLADADWKAMSAASSHIARLPLDITDRSGMSLAQIRAKARGIQRRTRLGIIVVDYLGIIAPPPNAPRNDRRVQVDFISQGLKDLARDLDVPVVALAQLNRGIEGRAAKIPTLADLRESGGIEAAADFVLLAHRDRIESPRNLRIAVEKNRHGGECVFELTFEGEFSRAVDNPWAAPPMTA